MMRSHTLCVIWKLSKQSAVPRQATSECGRTGSASSPYPVSLQRGQHLLPQLDLPRHLVDTVAAAQERLQGWNWGRGGSRSSREEEGGGRGNRAVGWTRSTHTYNFISCGGSVTRVVFIWVFWRNRREAANTVWRSSAAMGSDYGGCCAD